MHKTLQNQFRDFFYSPVSAYHLPQKLKEFENYYGVLRKRKDFLLEKRFLHLFHITDAAGKKKTLYSSQQKLTTHQIAQALFPRAYFCDLTAVFYHNLTNQVPTTMYVAQEGKGRKVDLPKEKKKAHLTDHQIFQAFIKQHRYTRKVFSFQKERIVFTERVWREEVGIEPVKVQKHFSHGERITSLERTLIDVCVAPQYCGGILNVLDYYRIAGERQLKVKRFLDIYDALAFVYPYWQAIGFVCDVVGLNSLSRALQKKFSAKNKFYLDHEAKTSWRFNEKWKLYYPEGIV